MEPNRQLKAAIALAGQTQRSVAELAGMPEVDLSRVICGHRIPTGREKEALSACLGRQVLELFPESGEAVGV